MASYYWVGGSGTWDNSSKTNWATVSGGAGGNGPPTSADNVFFDSLSGTGTCTTAATATASQATLNTTTLALTLGANLTLGSTFTFTTGTINLASYVFTINVMGSNSTSTRAINFGTGRIDVTGSGTTVWLMGPLDNFTYTGTPTVNFTYSGGVGTRTLRIGSTSGATESNSFNINITAGTDIINFGVVCKNCNFTGFSGSVTNAGVSTFYGSLTISSGMTWTASTIALSFLATSGTQQITTNGKTLDCPIIQNNPGATLQLQDNLTMGSTRAFTLTAGTLDLTGNSGNWTLSTGSFVSSNTNTRAISFGTGNITLTGNAASVVNFGNNAGLTISGTPVMNLTYSGSTGTRTITYGTASGSEAKSITMNITAGSDIIAITNGSNIRGLNFIGFTGSYTNAAINVYGDVTFVSGMTLPASANTLIFSGTSSQKLTSGQTLDFPISMNGSGGGIVLQDNLVGGSTRTFTQQYGVLDLNGKNFTFGIYSSNYSTTRSIAFGTSTFNLTANNATVWSVPTLTGFSYTGTPNVNLTYAGSVGTRTFNSGFTAGQTESNVVNILVTAGTDTVTAGYPIYVKDLNFTGFSGTFTTGETTIYGNATYTAGMTISASASVLTFASTSSGKTITSAGKTIDQPVTFNGVGGVWTCQDALTLGSTRALTLTNGTLKLKSGATSTVGSFVTAGTNQKYLGSSTPGTQATISDASGVNSVSYLTISDSFATGGATWDAFYGNGNLDAGNNTNWDFGETPVLGTEYTYRIRSFTQPRRF